MRSLDFSSWTSVLSTLMGLLVATCLMMGIRLLFMQTVQKKRERENRQINERLKTLIAAYKILGGSFTGTLHVSPVHRREVKQALQARSGDDTEASLLPETDALLSRTEVDEGTERQRRIRDAVEAALSDVILLGTEEQVRLAVAAANDMVAGQNIETAALVASLRDFIRQALDLEPVAADIKIPSQGPARPGGSGGGADRCGVHQTPDLFQAQNGQRLGNPPQPAGRGWHPAIGTPHHARSQGRVVADQLAYLAQIRLVVAQLRVQKHQHFGNARQGILASQQCVQLHR